MNKVTLNVESRTEGEYDQYPVFVTASETVLGLFDTACGSDKCRMPKKYAREGSRHFQNGLHRESTKEQVVYQEPDVAEMREVKL